MVKVLFFNISGHNCHSWCGTLDSSLDSKDHCSGKVYSFLNITNVINA